MATYIHLVHKDILVDEVFAFEIVMKCLRDVQKRLHLKGDGYLAKPIPEFKAGQILVPHIEELATECETGIAIDNSNLKWSYVANTLLKFQEIVEVPQDSEGNHYVDNPILSGKRIMLGDWTLDYDGISYNPKESQGFFIPKGWTYIFDSDFLEQYMRRRVTPNPTKEKPSPMSLLSAVKDGLDDLNSRSSKDRSEAYGRHLDSLSKILRTMMEECERRA